MTNEDKRLIEGCLPIKAISAEASREKSVRKGHVSTLHLWLTRQPRKAATSHPLRIQNPAKHLDHAKKEVVAARFFDIPAAAVEDAAKKKIED